MARATSTVSTTAQPVPILRKPGTSSNELVLMIPTVTMTGYVAAEIYSRNVLSSVHKTDDKLLFMEQHSEIRDIWRFYWLIQRPPAQRHTTRPIDLFLYIDGITLAIFLKLARNRFILLCAHQFLTNQCILDPGFQISDETFVDMEYADTITFFQEGEDVQMFLNELTKVILSFGMHSAPTKYKVIAMFIHHCHLKNTMMMSTPLTVQGEAYKFVMRYIYIRSCIGSDVSVADEVSARLCNARVAFSKLKHLWRQSGVSLDIKKRVYYSAVRALRLGLSERQTLSSNKLLLSFYFFLVAPLPKLQTSTPVAQTPHKTVIYSNWLVPGLHSHGPPTKGKLSANLHPPVSLCRSPSHPDPSATELRVRSPIVAPLTTFKGLSINRSMSVQC
ncbi:hypothetical protein CSKR_100260 [Clonorchis sinensis]|uniref:Reverse transcriptase domain-containing protein n=1 Tax=Clonorchis sinensis TaxID=79923 RepID=A0A3R7GQP4_CLOSI|nr:hypothetical protein CSKR_100260 [Clonorchis sinensis]